MNPCKTRSLIASLTANPRSTKPLGTFLSRLVESRRERDQTGLFFCDGLRAVHRLLESRHFPPELLVYAPNQLYQHPGGARLLERLKERRNNIPLVSVPVELLNHLSQSPEPQGIGAVVRQHWTPLAHLPPDDGLCYVALDTIRNPGNLGTVLRSLEAVGGAGLICLPPAESNAPSVDPFAPGVIRASMGSTFALRFVRTGGEEWERWRVRHNVRLIGTSPHVGEDYRSVRYGERVILWIGGERKGLSEAQMSGCDHLVRIPMAPTATADSLNLATATSVLLYEVFNQRTPYG
jgi:TrmH family RNA methyltransferase